MEHRSHRRRRNRGGEDQDTNNDLESEMLAPVRAPSPLRVSAPARVGPEVADRRRWAPGSPMQRPREEPRDFLGLPARVKVQPKKAAKADRPAGVAQRQSLVWRLSAPERAVFAVPRNVKVCLQRKTRREVLFAKGRTGKVSRRRRWTEISKIHCR